MTDPDHTTEPAQEGSRVDELQETLMAFVTGLEKVVNHVATSGSREGQRLPDPQDVFQTLQAYRKLRLLTRQQEPALGLFVQLTQDDLRKLFSGTPACVLIDYLEPAPSYTVGLKDLLSTLALAECKHETQTPTVTVQDVRVPPIEPVPVYAVPRSAAPTVPPPSGRAVENQGAAPVPVSGPTSPQFVDPAAAGLGGMSDDEVIAAVTGGGLNMVANPLPGAHAVGSSASAPQAPNQMSVPHPLIQQQRDPATGQPVGELSPQQLKERRARIESGLETL